MALHPSWIANNWLDAKARALSRRAVEERLESLLLADDAATVLDGGEWALLLTNVRTAAEGAAVAERITEVVSRPVDLDGESGRPLLNTGVAVATGIHRAPADLLDDAKAALALAIERGAGQAVVFDEQLRIDILHRFRMLQAMGRGFELSQLQLWYQPIVAIADGSTVAAEALLRWPGGSWMDGAAHIVSLAERSEVIGRLGDWVILTACRQAKRWADYGLVTHVNMSPLQLVQADVSEKVILAIEQAGLQPNDIAVEVTESAAMPQAAVDTIFKLKDAGVKICLDDFGTGYANLAALRTLPIDVVKLDRTVVAGIHRGSPAVAMVEAVVVMARALGMQVTAEGIETQEELDMIAACGCDLAQGFLLDRPMEAGTLETSLVSQQARRLA